MDCASWWLQLRQAHQFTSTQINSHQGSGFSNKATENKLLIQSTLNP